MLVVTNLVLVTMENCIAWKSGAARKSSLNLVTNEAKAKEEGRVKLTECFRCRRIVHIRADCRAKPHINAGVPSSAPKGKSVGNFEDHGKEVDVDDSTCETTETMPPLQDHRDEEYPFLDCWDGKQEQFDALQQVDLWARNAPKSEPDVKGCLTVSLPVCSVCQKLDIFQLKRHSMTSQVKEKTD